MTGDQAPLERFQQPVGQRRGQIGLNPQPARAGLLPQALGLGAGHGIVIRVHILVVHVADTAEPGPGPPRQWAAGATIVMVPRQSSAATAAPATLPPRTPPA